MKRLNFTDLLALIIEFDIENLEESLRLLEDKKMPQRQSNVVEASNDDILRFHRKAGGR